MNNVNIGNIIYWNPSLGYGFIEYAELLCSIFFHKSNCTYEDVQLFDNVTFQVSISNSKKHKGKNFAININLKERGNFKNYDLRIGIVQDWNGKFGFIKYPTDGKKIFLFHTRLLYTKNIQNEDLVIFNPIVSTKDTTQLFAFFAYPIVFEKDVELLKMQYANYQIPALKDYILDISKESKLSLSEKFELELMNLGFILTGKDYLNFIDILKRYDTELHFIPNYDLLSKYVSEIYLIQLWESDIIKSYSIDTIKDYFIRANADTKRLIVRKITEQDRKIILDYYFLFLQNANKLERINNDLKTFLSIIYRNEETRIKNLYEKTKSYLLSTLTPDELINLWLYDYIDGLSESFIIKNFNIGDKNLINQLLQKIDENGHRRYEELMSKIYEQYFIDIANQVLDFELEYTRLVKYLQVFEFEFQNRYPEIINILQKTLNSYQKFVLWVLNINIEFDAISFIQQNKEEINHYFRLKSVLRCYNEIKDSNFQAFSENLQIDIIELREFASSYKWNDVIYPTKILGKEDNHSFLNDVFEYNSICNKNIDIKDLADVIYNSVEKYNEIHLRLWLSYFFPNKKYYDYVGFSECFKNLTNDERREFRNKANEKDFAEVIEQDISEVKPCEDFEQDENETKNTYNAFVENLYFSNGFIRLRLETGKYTEQLQQEYSSIGLNRIPSNHFLNKIPIRIIVELESNKIIQVTGLNELFTQIHTGEIEKALGTIIEQDNQGRENYTYTEDWQLRKQVIDYLNASQDEDIKTTIVNEPKNLYRRLDEKSGIDLFEKTELFTIKVENEYAIIWENIDLSEDRATYVFKCFPENHSVQIQKIADAIVSFAQFRSSLSSAKDEEELQIFKNNFGFITSIRKQRGKNESFSNWLEKLGNALIQPIPKLPTIDELENIKNWTPKIPHTAKINKSKQKKYKESAIIKEKDLATTDLIEGRKQSGNEEQFENIINNKYDKQNSLLNALKTFNQYFTESLNLDI
jgi:cold shock CspA family protein